MDSDSKITVKGGEWLIIESQPGDIFTPEHFSEEQLMIREMCEQFIEAEVLPVAERMENLEAGLMPSLLKKAGELGILSVSVPEDLGGMGKDFVTSTLVSEGIGAGYSFSVAASAHAGIGTLPILYFGTPDQKKKYIPRLASGEWKGSYGLTEPGSGSDALGAKTTAMLSSDGKYYVLNGQKCWITNGGFADVYTIFAKIDGDKFSAFIVERGMEGFTQGPEEHKMGIRGSSTVQLFFQDCKVPVENLLGEIGKGHVIAFNILNIGRLKLCAAAIGAAKGALTATIKYANTREQFNTKISRFGAIQQKLAMSAQRIWAGESALYRTSSWIEKKEKQLASEGKPFNATLLGAAEEYAIECAILKVEGSELLDFVVDEGVQVHGGNGFSDEYVISRSYRDSRINRIYEGTNEINRLLIVDMLLKRALSGRLDLMKPATAVAQELMEIPDLSFDEKDPFAVEKKTISNYKKALLLIAGAAVRTFQMKLKDEQEILMNIADMAIAVFLAESTLLRVQQNPASAIGTDVLCCCMQDAADSISKSGREAVTSFATGDEQRMLLLGIKRYGKYKAFNIRDARRRIAERLIADDRYSI